MSSAAEDIRRYEEILRRLEQRRRTQAEVQRELLKSRAGRGELIVDPLTMKVYKVVGGTQVYEVSDLAGKADVLPTVDPGKRGPWFGRTKILSLDPELVYEPIHYDPLFTPTQEVDYQGIGESSFMVEVWALFQGGWGVPARELFGIPYMDQHNRINFALGNDAKEAEDLFKSLYVQGRAYKPIRGSIRLIEGSGFDSGKLIQVKRVHL